MERRLSCALLLLLLLLLSCHPVRLGCCQELAGQGQQVLQGGCQGPAAASLVVCSCAKGAGALLLLLVT
jgi:hypothetical protein